MTWTLEEVAAASRELAASGVDPKNLELATIESLWWADGTHPEIGLDEDA